MGGWENENFYRNLRARDRIKFGDQMCVSHVMEIFCGEIFIMKKFC